MIIMLLVVGAPRIMPKAISGIIQNTVIYEHHAA
jgi:hypothetical protein